MINSECIKKLEDWKRVLQQRKPAKVKICQKVLDVISLENPADLVTPDNQKLVTDFMRKVI